MRKINANKRHILSATVLLIVAIAGIVLTPLAVHAADVQPGNLPDVKANTHAIRTILQITFGIIGGFAFLNIVLSGFKYVTSAGEPQKTSEAKNGIIFSLLGLMIAIAAEAIVVFVVRRIDTP